MPSRLITGIAAVQYDLAQKGTTPLGHTIKQDFLGRIFLNEISPCISQCLYQNNNCLFVWAMVAI
jgi:hypothetical protein